MSTTKTPKTKPKRSSTNTPFLPKSFSSPPLRSGSSHTTLLYSKRLTYDDVLTGKLKIPAKSGKVLLPKKAARCNQDRIMVPFMDNKGELWEMEITYQGISSNWDKFVEKHALKHNDVICIYDDDPSSRYYTIDYTRNKIVFVHEMHSESKGD